MAIKITSDSTCDLSPELLERYQVTLLPLCVNLGDRTYYDGDDITPAQIFDHVSKTGQAEGQVVQVRSWSSKFYCRQKVVA